MPDNPDKLSQFWQELKRRKVVRVITVFAAAAFVILELVDIIADPLKLPEWFLTATIVFLCMGFIITVIVSWIYDIHPEGGIVKTEPAHEVKSEELPKSSNNWKVASYISFVVIMGLIVIQIYPRIFNPDKLKKMRDDQGMISIAVLPFDNLTGDSSLYFWQNGISEYLINKLGKSQELAVYNSQAIFDLLASTTEVNKASLSPDIARQTARKINSTTYITGNFIGKENDANIMLNLVKTENGELIWSTSVNGDLGYDFRAVLDQLSEEVRNYMEIKALENKVETDLSNAFPNSADAYRHYIDGLNAIVNDNYKAAIESLEMAFGIDSTFTFAAFYLAFSYSFGGEMGENMFLWTRRAYELKNNLPPEYRPWIELWYACYITEDNNDVRTYCDMMFEAALHSRFLWFDLGVTYRSFFNDYDKAISAYKKVDELNGQWEDDWRYEIYYEEYARTLLKADRPMEVERIADIGLKINPENDYLVRVKGAAAIMIFDSAAIQRYKEDLRSLVKKIGETEAQAEHDIGHMHRWAKDTLGAVEYYRRAYEMDKERLGSLLYLIYYQLKCNMNFEESLKLSEYLLEQNPESIAYLWVKGYSLFKLGNDQEALAILREAEDLAPKNRDLKRDIQEVERSLALQEQ